MKKNLSKSENSQVTALDNRIIEIANECANTVWDGEYTPDFKLVNLDKGGVTIRVCDGEDWLYSIKIEGGAIVYLYIHKHDTALTYHELWFINLINERADEITEATFETEVA